MTLRDRRRGLSSLEAGGHGINEVRRSQKERYHRLLQSARRSPDAKDPFQLLSHDDSRGSPSAQQQLPMEEREPHHTTSKRLTSISGFGPRSSTSKPRNAKSARELIREDVPAAAAGSSGIKITSEIDTEEGEGKGIIGRRSGDCPPPSRHAPPPLGP